MPKPPEIVGSLHIQPKVGAVAAELAEPKRHFGSDRSPPGHHPMQRLPRHTQQSRDFPYGVAAAVELRQNVLREEHARMSRLPVDLAVVNENFFRHKFPGQSYQASSSLDFDWHWMRILFTKSLKVAEVEACLLQNRLKRSFRDRLGKMNWNSERSPIILPEER